MTKQFIMLSLLIALFLNACKETEKQENSEKTRTEMAEKNNDDIVKSTSTDQNGKKLEFSFNNTKGTVMFSFEGETIELTAEKAASGYWYKNETFELRGKGNDLELKKDGKVVFEHKDDIVTSSLKDKDGQTLDMTFNNTTNRAKIYLNGGEQIEMDGQNPASGIWYKNEHYELRGKGEHVELTKDGKTIFKN